MSARLLGRYAVFYLLLLHTSHTKAGGLVAVVLLSLCQLHPLQLRSAAAQPGAAVPAHPSQVHWPAPRARAGRPGYPCRIQESPPPPLHCLLVCVYSLFLSMDHAHTCREMMDPGRLGVGADDITYHCTLEAVGKAQRWPAALRVLRAAMADGYRASALCLDISAPEAGGSAGGRAGRRGRERSGRAVADWSQAMLGGRARGMHTLSDRVVACLPRCRSSFLPPQPPCTCTASPPPCPVHHPPLHATERYIVFAPSCSPQPPCTCTASLPLAPLPGLLPTVLTPSAPSSPAATLDLHYLSATGAGVMLRAWLLLLKRAALAGRRVPPGTQFGIVTGDWGPPHAGGVPANCCLPFLSPSLHHCPCTISPSLRSAHTPLLPSHLSCVCTDALAV